MTRAPHFKHKLLSSTIGTGCGPRALATVFPNPTRFSLRKSPAWSFGWQQYDGSCICVRQFSLKASLERAYRPRREFHEADTLSVNSYCPPKRHSDCLLRRGQTFQKADGTEHLIENLRGHHLKLFPRRGVEFWGLLLWHHYLSGLPF